MAKRKTGVNRIVVHAGAAAQAVRLLRWWAKDGSDDDIVIENCRQSNECARDLADSIRRDAARRKGLR